MCGRLTSYCPWATDTLPLPALSVEDTSPYCAALHGMSPPSQEAHSNSSAALKVISAIRQKASASTSSGFMFSKKKNATTDSGTALDEYNSTSQRMATFWKIRNLSRGVNFLFLIPGRWMKILDQLLTAWCVMHAYRQDLQAKSTREGKQQCNSCLEGFPLTFTLAPICRHR